jgi:hypothetical protein
VFDLKITLSGLHLCQRVVCMLGAGKGGGFDLVEVVDFIELIIEDVIELRMLQNVSTFIPQPSLPFLSVPYRLLPLLISAKTAPFFIFVIILYNCQCFRRFLFTSARQAAIGRFFEVVQLAHLLLETAVVLLEFAKLTA